MGQTRIIRKYVNRRLYDTTESRYVNLEDLRRLILEGHEIRVTDRASGDDITTPVLLQIIGDAQRGGHASGSPDSSARGNFLKPDSSTHFKLFFFYKLVEVIQT